MLTRRSVLAGGVAGGLAAGLTPAAAAQDVTGGALYVSDIGHAMARVTVNGEPCLALLDNGYNPSAIAADFATARGLAGPQTVMINGGEARRTQEISVRLGAVAARVSAVMLDMADVAPVAGERVRMIAGRDLFAGLIVTLDFAQRSAELQRADRRFARASDAALFALGETRDGWQTLRVGVEELTWRAGVDLGSSAPLMLRDGEQTRRWLSGGRRWSTVASRTPRGSELVVGSRQVTRAQRVKIGRSVFTDMPVEIYADDDPVFGGCEAIIGAPLLGRFAMSLDVSGARLWLQAGPDTGAPFPALTIGLGTHEEDGGLRVLHVAANSPAEAAQIRSGDVIQRVNGAQPDRDVLRLTPVGETVLIDLAGGRQVRLAAQTYY